MKNPMEFGGFGTKKEDPKSNEETLITRRNLLIAGAAAVAAGGTMAAGMLNRGPEKMGSWHEGPYPTGDLAGRRVGDLFAYYLGLPEGSAIPEELDADFSAILSTLWDKKRAFVERRKPGWGQNTERAREAFLVPYQEALANGTLETATIPVLVERANGVVNETNRALSWEKLNQQNDFDSLSDEHVDLIKKMSAQINGEMLLAYSVTELMPSINDAKMNVDIFAFLAEHAGPQFLQSIPAIHDPYVSMGMFQFTSYALYDGEDGPRGASIINNMITDDRLKLPPSVIKLTAFEQQTRAAHLFAIENIARLVKSISSSGNAAVRERRLKTLEQKGTTMRVGLLQFVASAHHAPGGARSGYKNWLDKDFEGSHAAHCNRVLRDYIKKSHGNYHELLRRI